MGKNFKLYLQNELSKEINLIASDPDEHYAIEASSYLALTKIKDVVKDCICMGMSQDCVSNQCCSDTCLRQVSGIKGLNQMSTYHFACGDSEIT